MDWVIDKWGRKTPKYKMTPENHPFTYPLDLVKPAARLHMQRGEPANVPSIKDTMYQDTTWETDVLLMVEYYKWADDTLESN